MTAWDILVANSTAPVGSTAWVHLNNQSGGGGECPPCPTVGDFVCVQAESNSSMLIETEEGHDLVVTSYGTALVETDSITEMEHAIASDTTLTITEEDVIIERDATDTEITHIDDTIDVSSTITNTIIEDQT